MNTTRWVRLSFSTVHKLSSRGEKNSRKIRTRGRSRLGEKRERYLCAIFENDANLGVEGAAATILVDVVRF